MVEETQGKTLAPNSRALVAIEESGGSNPLINMSVPDNLTSGRFAIRSAGPNGGLT